MNLCPKRSLQRAPLYAAQLIQLLDEMVKANDEWMIRQYIEKHPKAGLYPPEAPDWDVFSVACEHGSLDVLHVLLDHYDTHIDSLDTKSLEQRGISLMGIACRFAQLTRCASYWTASNRWGQLNLGMVGVKQHFCPRPPPFLRSDSIGNGQMPLNQINTYGGSDLPRDVTVLHRGGLFWNAPGIRALLGRRGSNAGIADMVLVCDSGGRLPLHWAAMGPDPLAEDMLPENEVLPRIVDTFKLLLEGKQRTIDIQDNLGRTALFYAVGAPAQCSSSHSCTLARFLCENGADASLADTNGKTVLHELAVASHAGGPIDPALLDLMLSHGADVDHADMDGSTVLHWMARNLHQVKAANFLISRGADVNARDSQGNTPLHTATMTGVYFARLTREGKTEHTTLDERIRLHEEVIAPLLEAGGSSLMDQPNAAGKSPRQLLEEARSRWYADEGSMRRIGAERASHPDVQRDVVMVYCWHR